MPILTKEILSQGLKLEEKRSLVRHDKTSYDNANKEYCDWIIRYGYLLITEFLTEKNSKQ